MAQTASPSPSPSLTERERLQRMLANFHDTLIVLLIALRPLVWDGDAASPANLVYLALILLALFITAAEYAGGLRVQVRWSWTGILFAAMVAILVPAAMRAPILADGAAFFWQLVLHLGLSAYLLQIIPGRERVAWSALVAGLGAEAAIGWVQGLYVLPKMAAGSALGDTAVAAEGIAASDFVERIQRGGWFGTFTLSNTLAAWLLLALIPMVGAAWRCRGVFAISLAFSIVIAGSGLFLATRSKGALIAVALAAGIWWLLYQRHWWRWLPVPVGIVAVGAMFLIPGWSDGVDASARVRWGYWSGAVTLVREAPLMGHGIGAFAQRSSGVLPLWAEPSRLVHNEPLETAVVAGIPAAVVLIFLLLLIMWPRSSDRTERLGDGAVKVPLLAPITLLIITGYLSLLGMIDGNLGWWPGGDSLVGQGMWGLLVGAGLAAVVIGAGRIPLPTGRWFRLALAALAVHSLIDFDLHSFAVIGTLLVVAILAGGQRYERLLSLGLSRGLGVVLLVGVMCLGVGWVRWAHDALDLRNAQDLVRALRLTRDPVHVDDGFATLAAQLGVIEPPAGDRRGRNDLIAQAVATGLSLSDTDPTIAVQLISILPPSPERLAQLDALLPRVPYHLPVARLRAQDHLAAGRWRDAITEMQRGVSLAPAYIPARQELEALLGQIADRDPSHAAEWRSERDQAAAERATIEPIVDYRNRGK